MSLRQQSGVRSNLGMSPMVHSEVHNNIKAGDKHNKKSHRKKSHSKKNRDHKKRQSTSGSGSESLRYSKDEGRRSRSDSMSESGGAGSASERSSSTSVKAETKSPFALSDAPLLSKNAAATVPAVPVGSDPFSERLPWSEAEILYEVDGSLANLKSMSNEDGKVPLILGQGVMLEKITPKLADSIQSKLALHSRSNMMTSPEKATLSKFVIKDLTILGSHNGYPSTLRFEHPAFVAASDNATYINSQGQAVNYLTYTLKPGETISNKVVMTNPVKSATLNIYNDYSNYNQHNLRQDSLPAPSKDGIERWSVPYTPKSRHPVIDLAQAKMVKEGHVLSFKSILSKSAMKAFKRDGAVPSALLEQSKDDPSRTFISKQLFDVYEPRVIRGMQSSAPLSDVSNPYAFVSRTGGEYVPYADAPQSQSRIDSVGSKKEIWTNQREIFSNRTTSEARSNAVNTDYKAWVRIKVRFAETKDLASGL